MGGRLCAKTLPKEDDFVIPLVCHEFDVTLFRQSAKGAKQHMPAVMWKSFGEIGEHHALASALKSHDAFVDPSLNFRTGDVLAKHKGAP